MSGLIAVCVPGDAAILLCDFDPDRGHLVEVDRVSLPDGAGKCAGVPLAKSADGRRIFAAWRGETPSLYSLALDPLARRLNLIGQATLPASMCYAQVAAHGRLVLTASYTGSTIALSPIDDDGWAGEPLYVRDSPYAHCLTEAPNGLLYQTSLRGDRIRTLAYTESMSALSEANQYQAPTGSGPRHIVFSSDGTRAYLISEFSGTLTSFSVDAATGALSPLHSSGLLPEGEKAWAAELLLSPDGRFLYASERRTSQLFGFRIGANGAFEPVCRTAAPECPRAFGFDASGRYLIALGEKNGEAQVFRLCSNGTLEPGERVSVGSAPSWILAID